MNFFLRARFKCHFRSKSRPLSSIKAVAPFFLLILGGCALFDPKSDEEESLENDPIAQAALSVRDSGLARRDVALESDTPLLDSRDSSAIPTFHQILLGMSMLKVRALWGNPQDVETAGEVQQGNQRWIYTEGVAGRYGLSTNRRIVYFEQGRVAGWESR